MREKRLALILSVCLGGLGIDRIYMGYFTFGLLKLLSFGGFGVWWLIDIVYIALDKLPDADGHALLKTRSVCPEETRPV